MPAPRARLPFWADLGAAALVLAFVGGELSGAFGVLGERLPFSPFTALLAVGAAAALHRLLLAPLRLPLAPLVAMGAVLAAVTASYLHSSENPVITAAGVTETLKNLTYVAVLLVLAPALRHPRLVLAAVALPAGAIGLFSLVNEYALGNRATLFGFDTVTSALGVGTFAARHAGPLPDANFWGRFLVVALAFAMAYVALARRERRHTELALGCLALAGIAGGIYLTGSRGTFLATALVLALLPLLLGVRPRAVGLALLIAVPLALAVPGVGSRLVSASTDSSVLVQEAALDGSVRERLATQRVASAMVEDAPFLGVGPESYFDAFPRYAAATGQDLERVVAPHNLYLGLWAQVGLVGLLAWLAVFAVGVVAAARAWVRTRRTPGEDRTWAAALLTGQLAWLTASLFLHLSYIRVELLLVVLAATHWYRVDRTVPRAVPSASTLSRGQVRVRLRPALLALFVAVVSAAGALGLVVLRPAPVQASATAYLAPETPGTYRLSLRTRTVALPTYAVVVGLAADGVNAQGDPRTGQVVLTAVADDEASARRLVDDAVATGTRHLGDAGLLRLFRPVWGPVQTAPVPPSSTLSVGALGAGALLGGGLTVLVLRRRRTG